VAVESDRPDPRDRALDRAAAQKRKGPCEGSSGPHPSQDAVPLSLGRNFSGYRAQAGARGLEAFSCPCPGCGSWHRGTRWARGLQAPRPASVRRWGGALSQRLGLALLASAPNKISRPSPATNRWRHPRAFHGCWPGSAPEDRQRTSGCAVQRPRCGLGERLVLPRENEPGLQQSLPWQGQSPPQCESLTMVAIQVMGNNTAVQFAASPGNCETQRFQAPAAHNLLESWAPALRGLQRLPPLSALRSCGQHRPHRDASCIRSLIAGHGPDTRRSATTACQIAPTMPTRKTGSALRMSALLIGQISASSVVHWVQPKQMVISAPTRLTKPGGPLTPKARAPAAA